MKDRVDEDIRPFDLEEEGIREAAEKGTARLTVHKLVRLGMASDRRETCIDGSEKLAAERGTLVEVSSVGLLKIKLGLRREPKPFHFRRSSLLRTCRHDLAAEGLRACRRRRLASSFRCASVTGMVSGVAARLSHTSSSRWSRSATLSDRASLSTLFMTTLSTSHSRAASSPEYA